MATQAFDNGATVNLINAGLVAGTTSSYTTTATTGCVIRGKFTTQLTAQTNIATPTLDANTGAAFNALAANQACVLMFGINAAGAIQMAQGPIISTLTGVTTTIGGLLRDPQAPGTPNNFCPIGYVVVQTAPSAAAWTPGSSNWTASGVSCSTFQNVYDMPDRPQAS